MEESEGRLVRNPIDPMLRRSELAVLPLPDFGCLRPASSKCLGIESSRGCLRLLFLQYTVPKTLRSLDSEVVIDRLDVLLDRVDRTTSRCVHIVDDEFSLNPAKQPKSPVSFASAG